MLNLNLGGSGNSVNFIRFMPSVNAWQNSDKVEFTLKKVVFDIENVQTGWLLLETGTRDWQPDVALGKKGAQPTPEHKRGFIVKFYNPELGVVEWSANGTGPNMGLNELYQLCSAQHGNNPNLLPLIEYKGARAEKIGKGNTRIPEFKIVQWVKRPKEMNADGSSSTVSAKAVVVEEDDFDPFPAPKAAAVAAIAQTPKKAPVDDAEMFE